MLILAVSLGFTFFFCVPKLYLWGSPFWVKDKRTSMTVTLSGKSKRENTRTNDLLITYAHRSRWSIGHQRPLAIAHCSGLL